MSSTALGYLGLRLAASVASDMAPKHRNWELACRTAKNVDAHMKAGNIAWANIGVGLYLGMVDEITTSIPLVMQQED